VAFRVEQLVKKYKNQVEENEQSRLNRNQILRDGNISVRSSTPGGEIVRGGAAVKEVEPDSIAADLGLREGVRILEINGEMLTDSIQLKSAEFTEHLTLTVIQADGAAHEYDIEKDPFEPLGLHFDAELFNGVRRCVNKCPFCFVDQLPPRAKSSDLKKGEKNLRRTLYVRDDDYRLSFLHGHYITLTNLKVGDYERIIAERLSPLCVSVHATDPQTRIKMVGNKSGGEIIERLQYLIENKIQINAQIVLCPEWNDGAQLDRSVRDLMELRPGIESLAVVPAGLTKFLPDDRGLRTVRPEEARRALRQLEPFQKQAKKETGQTFVYASDEMYLLAGEPMPPESFYDGYPQFANGVGTIRSFREEIKKLRRRKLKTQNSKLKITLVTGALAAPAMRELSATLLEKNLARARVKEIKNTFWGGNVGCAGLIMGEEIIAQMDGEDCGDYVFLPPDAVDAKNRMLDDITLDELSIALNVPVRCDANGPLELANLLGNLR